MLPFALGSGTLADIQPGKPGLAAFNIGTDLDYAVSSLAAVKADIALPSLFDFLILLHAVKYITVTGQIILSGRGHSPSGVAIFR